MAELDILIVNYNTKDHLKNLLDTIHSDREDYSYRVYIADNGSTDGSKEWLLRVKDYDIEYVKINNNVGYAAAINELASVSNSPILAAVNADTWFTSNHVRQAVDTFKDNPQQAILGPKQMDEKCLIRHGGIFWDGVDAPSHRGWTMPDVHDLKFKDRKQCWTVSGSIYYVRRSVWDEMTNNPAYRKLHPDAEGAFLPTFMYFEETFCSIHAQHLGYEVWYDGTIETAGHAWHASAKVGSNVGYFKESREIYKATADAMGIKHECK